MDLPSTAVAISLDKGEVATNPDKMATNLEPHQKQPKCRRIQEIPLATTIEDLERLIEEHTKIEGSAYGLTLALYIALNGREDPQNDDFFKSSYALIFFGVPNLGLRYETLREIVSGQPNEQLIHDLQVDEESQAKPFLETLKQNFIQCCKAQEPTFQIISYYEQKKTKMVKAMTKDSACRIGHVDNFYRDEPLDTDHSNLVKFSGRSDNHYARVVGRITNLAEDAPGIIDGRFAPLKELSLSERCHWNDLNVPPYADFKDSEKVSKPVEGTLQWLINDDFSNTKDGSDRLRKNDFIMWRDSDQSCNLLVTAAPGQGKSVLSNFVVDNLKDHLKKQQYSRYKVIYYFCNVKNEEKYQTALSILRALIVQLCEDRRLFQRLPNRFKGQEKLFFSASLAELWAVFSDLTTTDIYTRIYCVIDGLDVYMNEMDSLLGYFNGVFSSQTQEKSPFFKLFCTSRPEGFVINSGLSPRRVLRASTDDLTTFVNNRLESFPKKKFSDARKEYIRTALMDRAEQTFLWISIVLGELQRLSNTSPARIKRVLEAAPKDITELYTNLIQKIMEEGSECIQILAWTTFAKRPLSLEELQIAIAVGAKRTSKVTSWEECVDEVFTLDTEWIHDNLGTLVDVIDDRPYLIHQTLRDFLRGTYIWKTEIMSDFTRPELLLANITMTYLAFNEFRSERLDKSLVEDTKNKYPFVDYAAYFWYAHIRTSNEARKDIRKLEAILYEPTTQFWLHATYWGSLPESVRDIAIIYDIGWLANLLLINTPDNLSVQFDESLIVSFATRGRSSILEEILKHPKLKVTEAFVKTMATWNKGAMRVLLSQRGGEVKITEEVLKAAVRGYGGKEVIEILLSQRGGEVKITEDVLKAAMGGHRSKEVIELLLQERGDEVKTEDVLKAAMGAAMGGHRSKEVIELLLQERGGEVKITEDVLKAAIGSYQGKEVIELLLQERGDEIKTEDVLEAAMGSFQAKEVIELLLQERGDEVKTEDVLKAAMGSDQATEVIELLLRERGGKVYITDDMIKAAAENKYRGAVGLTDLLLNHRRIHMQTTDAVVSSAAPNEQE
ncbi:hypothetical protein V502_02005 [Pseudogymnoascus sp. VKM F-4520 (FW-2644)]|nr:hypothetical protein V502_02005 [Pseudogymnoascus sp. VKM F-4520 (FW-2644)]